MNPYRTIAIGDLQPWEYKIHRNVPARALESRLHLTSSLIARDLVCQLCKHGAIVIMKRSFFGVHETLELERNTSHVSTQLLNVSICLFLLTTI